MVIQGSKFARGRGEKWLVLSNFNEIGGPSTAMDRIRCAIVAFPKFYHHTHKGKVPHNAHSEEMRLKTYEERHYNPFFLSEGIKNTVYRLRDEISNFPIFTKSYQTVEKSRL